MQKSWRFTVWVSRGWDICFHLTRGRAADLPALSSSHWAEKKSRRAFPRCGSACLPFQISSRLPSKDLIIPSRTIKANLRHSIFVPHKPGDGFCLNTERVSSLNLIRPLRNHGSGKPWLKFSRAATSERNQGKRGVPGNVHVKPSSARLIERHFNLLS